LADRTRNFDAFAARRRGGAASVRLQESTKASGMMLKILLGVHPLVLLLIATTLEVSGDAVVRMAIYSHVGVIRIALFLGGAALLFGYGSFLNLAPIDFGRVVGLYIATLFVVWQVINLIVFRTLPTLPILVGGGLVIAGGVITTFWQPG
jgi:hypothetical protein